MPLLYVSDFGNFDVYVYAVPTLKLVGKLTGFFEPEGVCSDAAGHVWIANTGTQQMLEFGPGNKKPIATLTDDLGYPVSCAVDAASGDLAVANLFGASGSGGILVYRHAAGTPIPYANPDQFFYYFDAYDDKGTLYVSGMTSKNVYSLSSLQRGKKTMSSITIKGGTLSYPGTVSWSGSSLVLGDQECRDTKTSCLYEAAVSGSIASITKSIPLTGSCDVAQVALQKTQMFGGNDDYCTHGKSSLNRWAFPAGGKSLDSVTGVHDPIGAAISQRESP